MTAIWQDTTYEFTGNTLEYYVKYNDAIIFSGKAYAYPGTNSGIIHLNKICENYLSQELTILENTNTTGTTTHSEAVGTFSLYDSTNTLLDSYTFYWDYSYDVNATTTLSKPVNGKFTADMWKLETVKTGNTIQTSYRKNASTTTLYPNLSCGDFALYYLNRYGGWDSLLIEGKVVESDSFSTANYEKQVNAPTAYYNRGNNRFRNEITHKWELNTGWLTDSQSRTLAVNLLSSNKVYLHKLTDNVVIPVDITNSETEYKKFNNERRLVSYTINVTESNKQIIL